MPIYNGTQKIKMSGIDKIYVGTTLVYQNAPLLVSIALSGQTTSFHVGDAWSFGGTVTATYSNGSTADVTAATTFSGGNTSSAGTKTVTATYTEGSVTVTATYNITVTLETYTLKYRYSGNGNTAGRVRVKYYNASGTQV